MSTLDLDWVRAQFPALAETVHGQSAVFFDGPGGTQVTQSVIDAISNYLIHTNANTHGAFLTSMRTDDVIADAHAAMADLLGCDPDEVVFGPNMTTLTFAISRSIGCEIQPGDEIVLTRLDHDANFSPWQALEERGAVIKIVDIDIEDCTLDMDDLRRQITPRTKLIAAGYASNAVGTINDVAEIVRLAKSVGALTYIDAVHYAPHGPIDVRALDCDFLACSPYKFFAPHMGALYGKREHLTRLHPYKVRPADDRTPDRWETGTKNHEGLAGVTAAIKYLAEIGNRTENQEPRTETQEPGTEEQENKRTSEAAQEVIQNPKLALEHSEGSKIQNRREALLQAMTTIQAYERTLSEKLIAELLRVPGLTFYGISDSARFDWRTPTVSVRVAGQSPRELAEKLAERGIFVWDGNYYAINLTERLGVEAGGGMLRIGLVHYNTAEEIDRLLAALEAIV
jgi:cysteine desulfurase family protein (TIGR01976 family)